MKKLSAILFVSLLSLVACSNNSDDDDGGGSAPVSALERPTLGNWASECLQAEGGIAFIEVLSLKAGGNGSQIFNIYNTQDCSGEVARTQGPSAFKYSSKAGDRAGHTRVTVTANGQTSELEVTVDGENMSIQTEGRTINYQRVGGAPPPQRGGQPNTPGQGGGTTEAVAFDRMATGAWASQDCYQGENGTTYMEVLQISGKGQAASIRNIYQSGNCSGTPRGGAPAKFTYTVDRFANGGGQITINGQPLDVTFQGNTMTVNSEQGSTTYIKVK